MRTEDNLFAPLSVSSMLLRDSMRFSLLFCLMAVAACAIAQPLLVNGDVCLDVEVVAIHNEGPLEGMTTYRLYATLPGPQDVVTTVFGDVGNPTALVTTTEWYQDANGGQFPCANNPLLFDLFPELAFDSWLTLGIDGPPSAADGEECPQVVMSSGSPFVTEFENGQSFVIDDLIGSAWFCVPTTTNGLPDEDGRVLLAQLTTDGDIDGVLYLQILPGGVGTLAEVVELPLFGDCDEISPNQCPEAIEAVQLDGCLWGFEVSDYQPGEQATWFFGDEVTDGGHYAEYNFAADGDYIVGMTFFSDLCPEGVDLETVVVVDGCTEPDCGLELELDMTEDSIITVIPVAYPDGVELIYSLNGSVIQEGGSAVTLPEGTVSEPFEVCVFYVSEDCPEGVLACTGSLDYEPDCPDEVWVGGAGCEYIFSICDYTEGEQVFWEFTDGLTGEGHFTWQEFPEDGLYDACATYVSPTCPDTTVLCTTVEVVGCEPVECTLDIFVEWTDPEAGWALLIADGAPEGALVYWYDEEGNVLAEGEVADLVDVGGVICAAYETPECPMGVEACVELEPWEPAEFECGMAIEAVQGADGTWTLTAVVDSVPGEDFIWEMSDGSVLYGQEVNHFFATGADIETACVTATFYACEEVLTVCVDLENVTTGFCEEVEVTLDGETLEDLLSGLDMAWTLAGDAFDLQGDMSLDPAEGELGTLVLCLPPGCYGMSFDMQGVPGLDGLPGMTLSLAVGEEEEAMVDLAVLEEAIELEFGVQTDCGASVLQMAAPLGGLSLYPNPAETRMRVTWLDGRTGGALQWTLRDATGRVVDGGSSQAAQWEVDLGARSAGTYFIEVVDGARRQVGRVMVTR